MSYQNQRILRRNPRRDCSFSIMPTTIPTWVDSL
jgi:hypothetical protein